MDTWKTHVSRRSVSSGQTPPVGRRQWLWQSGDEARRQGCLLCPSGQHEQKGLATLSNPLSWDTQGDCLGLPGKRHLNYENSKRKLWVLIRGAQALHSTHVRRN